MHEIKTIDITPDNILEYGVCGYKNIRTPGLAEKAAWYRENYAKGLRIKSVLTEKDGVQGMIEYIPGEYCWRPVKAEGYIFIHCIFTGYKSKYKGEGLGSRLLDVCLEEAQRDKKYGAAVVTRTGSFMAGSGIFIKKGFKKTDDAPPDFELLAVKFKKNAPDPIFRKDLQKKTEDYNDGLFILRAGQCPYTVKNVNEIAETSVRDFGITPVIVDLENYKEAQESPCAFGTFSIIYNGEIVSHHPISNTRFRNIMKAKSDK